MKCPKCKIELKPGIAIQQTWTCGVPDFGKHDRIVTMSAGGPGKLIQCEKCPECGFSLSRT